VDSWFDILQRKRFLSSPKNPDQFWSPLRLLFNVYQRFFPGGNAGGA
jgi:hypothetical protein